MLPSVYTICVNTTLYLILQQLPVLTCLLLPMESLPSLLALLHHYPTLARPPMAATLDMDCLEGILRGAVCSPVMVVGSGTEQLQFVMVSVHACMYASFSSGSRFNAEITSLDHICSDPPMFTNGQIVFTSNAISPFDFGTIATYICDLGFSLNGNGTRTCTGDDSSPIGMWTGDNPTCICEYLF